MFFCVSIHLTGVIHVLSMSGQKDHRGGGDNLVQMRNVQVDLSYFHDEGVAKEVMAA